MSMSAPRMDWTVDMLDELPDDGNRYEIIDGELLVTPAPSSGHQHVVGALYSRLRAYLRPFNVARAMLSPSDVRREDWKRNRVQPDVFAVRLIDGKQPEYPFNIADLILSVEVESVSNSAYDYRTKRRLYLASGIPEFWSVSPDARTFSRWRDASEDGELLTTRFEWQPAGMPEPLLIDIPEFFDDALG
jgi:Uma2 family endonuclease